MPAHGSVRHRTQKTATVSALPPVAAHTPDHANLSHPVAGQWFCWLGVAGSLVVFSAIALDEDEMAWLEAYGRPAFLVVPSDKHRLDAKIWKDRYPAMQVVAPEGARAKIEKIVPVDTVAPRFDDLNVQFVAVPGTRGKEAALVVRTPNGTTLVLNDLVGNIRNESGVGGWLLRMAGFAGKEPQIPKVVKMALIKDANALRAQLLQWAQIESLKRILVSHGSPIEETPDQTLRALARSLEEGTTAGQRTDRALT
jgi:hypothetical protein